MLLVRYIIALATFIFVPSALADLAIEWGDCAESTSAMARVDMRESFGGRLTHGIENIGTPDGSAVTQWNTGALTDGWYARTSGTTTISLAAINAPAISIEEGRMASNTTWNANMLHLLRNNVVIPKGITLTIEGGTIVKFTRDTQIIVEDGGSLIINDSLESVVCFAQAESDNIGGDTDMRDAAATWLTIPIRKFPSGTVTEHGYVTMSEWGECAESTSMSARVDMRESFGGRLTHGVENIGTADGTATTQWNTSALTDGWHTQTSGSSTVSLATINAAAISIEEGRLAANTTWDTSALHLLRNNVVIPNGITLTIEGGSIVKFTQDTRIIVEDGGKLIVNDSAEKIVSFAQAESDNIGGDTDMRDATASWLTIPIRKFPLGTVTENGYVKTIEWGEWSESTSAVTRVDTRESFGGRLAHGVENIGAPDGSAATQWNTTEFADGWHVQTTGTLSVSLAVINSPAIAVEEGRLTVNTTWDGNVLHLLRNNVVIPSGITLTIEGGAKIKFTQDTQIVVEDGGNLIINDSVGSVVYFAQAESDNIGGDTDMRDATASWLTTPIRKYPSGTVTEHGYVTMSEWGDCAESASAMARVDMRESFGGRLTHGIENIGTPDGSAVTQWNTGAITDGWYAQTSGTTTISLATINAPAIAIEEGRLGANATWNANALHLLRNNVAIPNGITLTIEGGSIVKFTKDTQIVVEDGGALIINDRAGNIVCFAQAENDNIGGDTDMRDLAASWLMIPIRKYPSGTVTEHGYVTMAEWGDWTEIVTSAFVRVDTRDGYGGRLVHGVENIGTPDGSATTQWNTVTLADGWHMQTSGTQTASLSVINSPSVSIEEGRLGTNTTWTTDTVHVVRNRVVVPSGATLTIVRGAVVKFTEDTGILVELGGTLDAGGAIFTHIADDSVGGDTNADENCSLPLSDRYTIEGAGQFVLTDCDFRYRTVVLQQGGAISGGQIWTGNCVYRITGDIIVPSGAMLTILEGAIVKFDADKRITVNAGGTLNVVGSLHKKVIFTSIKDDAYGGDTNKDGDATFPQPGDWTKITVSGTATFKYASILYSAKGTSTDDALLVNGGTVVFENSTIAHAQMYAVGLESGHFYMTNSVILDAFCAFRHFPADPIINSVIYDCTRLSNNSGQNFRNCVIANIVQAWDWSGGSGNSYKNCVIYNSPNISALAPPAGIGTNGNVWADPLFREPANGDFTLKVNSPCIDAADGSIASVRDYFGQERADDMHVDNIGTPSANGAYPDIGIFEMTANAVSEIDLAVSQVVMRPSANTGDTIQIRYTVTNVGSLAARGISRNELSFVGVYGASKVGAESVSVTLDLEPGASIELTTNVKVPSLAEGDWHLQLLLNADRTIFEGRNTGNNLYQTPDAIRISMAPLSGTTTATINGNSSQTFRIEASANEAGTILIYAPEGLNIYGAFGYTPGAGQHDVKAVYCGNGVYAISVPQADGSLYLSVENTTVEDKVISIEKANAALSILGVSTNKLPGTGQVTFSIYGTGFTESSAVLFRNGAQTITPTSIKCLSPVELSVTVVTENATVGNYDVIVSDEFQRATTQQYLVVSREAEAGKLQAKLIIPDSVRQGRQYICYIEYKNIGDVDLLAPIFQVVATGCTVGYKNFSSVGMSKLQFVGAGHPGAAGILAPGTTHRISFMMSSGANNSVTLHSSDQKEYFPAPWSSTAQYLSDISIAATRIGLRGGNATDFERVFDLAKTMRNENPISAISGFVRDTQGSPSSGVMLSFVETNRGDAVFATTDSDGYFTTVPLLPGEYFLKINTNDALAGDQRYIIIGKDDCNNLKFIINNQASCRVRVGGARMKNVSVHAVSRETGMVFPSRQEAEQVYVFQGLPDGVYQIEAQSEGAKAFSYVMIRGEGGTIVEVEMNLAGLGALRGTIEGIADASTVGILIAGDTGGGACIVPAEDGSFEAGKLPAGNYNVCLLGVHSDEYAKLTGVALEAGSEKTIVFRKKEAPSAKFDQSLRSHYTNRQNDLFAENFDYPYWSLFWYEVRPRARELLIWAENVLKDVDIKYPDPCLECNCDCQLSKYRSDLELFKMFALEKAQFTRKYNTADFGNWAKAAQDFEIAAGQFAADLMGYDTANAIADEALEAAKAFGAGGTLQEMAMNYAGVQQYNEMMKEIGLLTTGAQNFKLEFNIKTLYDARSILEHAINVKQQTGLLTRRLRALGNSGFLGAEGQQLAMLIKNIEDSTAKLDTFVSGLDAFIKGWQFFDAGWAWSIGVEELRKALPLFDKETLSFTVKKLGFNSYTCTCMQCPNPPYSPQEDQFCPIVPQSCDPNEMSGPFGAGDQRCVVPGEWLDFKVHFENQATATGAAQEVHVNNALSEYLDWKSFELAEVSFANQIEMRLLGKKNGQIEVAQKGTSTKVRVVASYDEKTGKVYWYMRSVDPTTPDNWPIDPYAGFLQPNDATGRGEGYVAYRVKVKANAPHNVRIDSSAEIVFDYNAPIVTDPAWFNTVYADGPTDPVITKQPSGTSVVLGGSTSLTVTATGYTPLSYQWYKSGSALDAKTTGTLSLTNVTDADAGDYFVTVTNIFSTVTSNTATLTILTPPSIAWVANSGSQTVQDGATATFAVNVIAGTAPFTYKWSKNNTLITSASSVTYTTPATLLSDNGSTFRVEVINSAGTASLNATLAVTPSPATLAQQIKDQLQASGTATVAISGTVDFSLLVGGVTLTSGKTIVGADANSTIIGGITIPSGAKDVVIDGVNITGGTLNITGASDVEITHCTFTNSPVSVSGGADNIAFSWNKFTATGSGGGSAMTISNAGAATGIILHHNLFGAGLKSDMPSANNARVYMFNNYIATTGNTTATVVGAGAQILSVNNVYQGTTNPLTKQSNGLLRATGNFMMPTITGTTAPGEDKVFVPGYSNVMQPAGIDSPPNAETLVSLITTNAGNTAGQNSVTPTSTNGTARITASVTGAGASTANTSASVPDAGGFTLTANATGFTSSKQQWYRDNFAIASATAATHSVTNASATAHAGAYAVAMTAATGEIVSSAAFTVTVGAPVAPVITTHPASQTITAGGGVTFTVIATGANLTYQWQKGGANISGATGASYRIVNAQQSDAGSFRVVVTNAGGSVTSNAATLTVNTSGGNGGGGGGSGGGGGGGAPSLWWLAAVVAMFALRGGVRRHR